MTKVEVRFTFCMYYVSTKSTAFFSCVIAMGGFAATASQKRGGGLAIHTSGLNSQLQLVESGNYWRPFLAESDICFAGHQLCYVNDCYVCDLMLVYPCFRLLFVLSLVCHVRIFFL